MLDFSLVVLPAPSEYCVHHDSTFRGNWHRFFVSRMHFLRLSQHRRMTEGNATHRLGAGEKTGCPPLLFGQLTAFLILQQ